MKSKARYPGCALLFYCAGMTEHLQRAHYAGMCVTLAMRQTNPAEPWRTARYRSHACVPSSLAGYAAQPGCLLCHALLLGARIQFIMLKPWTVGRN